MVPLLALPLLTCLALVAVLAYLGLHVLKREIIFIDIALAQLAAVGAIAAHLAFGVHGESLGSSLASFGFVLGAAAFYAVVRGRVSQIPLEAIIGVSYAIAAAGALFLLGVGPGGHVHVQHMLAGSILWARGSETLVCVVAFAGVGALFRVFRRPLTRISEDYEGAARAGVHVVGWDFVFYALCGAVITLAVRVGGIVLVFAFLIIPATISAVLSSAWSVRLVVAWGAGAAASLLGLLFAYRLDFSVGPSVAMFLGVELVLAGAYGLRRSRGVGAAAAGTLVLALGVLALGGGGSRGGGPRPPDSRAATPPPAVPEVRPAPPGAGIEDFSARLRRAKDVNALRQLYVQGPDGLSRHEVVLRALELDRRAGAKLAVRYLRSGPPLFFAQEVVEKLEELAGRPLEYDVTASFDAPANERARRALREAFGLGPEAR